MTWWNLPFIRFKAPVRPERIVIYRIPTSTRKAVDCSIHNAKHQQLAAELRADRLKAECGKA